MQILKVKEWLKRDSIRKKWEASGLLTDLIGLRKSENIAQLFESQASHLLSNLDIQPEQSTFKTKEQS